MQNILSRKPYTSFGKEEKQRGREKNEKDGGKKIHENLIIELTLSKGSADAKTMLPDNSPDPT